MSTRMSSAAPSDEPLVPFLARAVELAEGNVASGQLPFGALVIRDGVILAEAVNTALRDDDPTAHAEVDAVRAACRALGVLALHDATIVSSCRPCPMCEGVALVAGVREIVYAAPAEDAAAVGLVLSPAAAAVQERIEASGLGIARLVPVPGADRPFRRYRAWLEQGVGSKATTDAVAASGAVASGTAASRTAAPGRSVPAEPVRPVSELRVALTVPDYERAIVFYRDALGLPVVESWSTPEGSGSVLAAGRATLEVISTDQAALIDRVEVGRRVAGPVRLALEVADSAATAEALVAAGAERVAEPVVTPWNHRNARVAAPDGMQLTLFTVLEGAGD